MIFNSDLMEALKSKKGKYVSITITTAETYYGELKEIKNDYLLLELKLRGEKGKTSIIIPYEHIAAISI